MNRKEFIKTSCFACVGVTVLGTLFESCSGSSHFAQTTTNGNKIAIKKSEFIKTENEKTTQRKFVLVKVDKYNFPIGVYKLSEGNFSALLMECTHKSCELQPQGEYLMCPRHGSEFNNKGVVQNPPAEQNLQTFTITTDHENIYIQL